MIIGDRLRALRAEKNFSQGDIEEKTGLLRCYVSRVENGHTVPSVETLEKIARALEIPMYKLFYENEEPPKLPNLLKRKSAEDILWGSSGEDARMLAKFRRLFGRMEEDDRNVLFSWRRRWRSGRLFDWSEPLAFCFLCLPYLRPPRPLRLRNFPPGGSGHGVPLAVLARRRICSRQFAQDCDCFIQLRQFLVHLCSLTLKHLHSTR